MAVPATSLLADFPEAYRDVVRFLTRRTGNPEDARELAHDVWVRLAEREREGTGSAPNDPRAYLFTIAQNIAVDHLRKRRLVREHAALLSGDEPSTPDIADSLMYRQVLAIVDATLSALPDRTREAFILHRMQGAGQAELAERFGVSRNTIERDVMTAMDAVQSALEAWHAGGRSGVEGPRRSRRKALAALLGVAATATTATALWRWWQASVPTWQNAFATPHGRLATFELPDGSSVMLDADSRIDASFTGAARTLHLLRGAAYFAVAHDAQRPFSVQAADVRIVVTGTRFGVDLGPSGVLVQVEGGSVRVEPSGGQALQLGAGDSVRVEPGRPPLRSRVADDAFMSWRKGELVFDRTPLADAMARLDRYAAGGHLVSVDAAVADLPLSGRVNIVRSREWLAALPAALLVRVEATPEGGLAILPR
jgi:RNA polymerase sigma factor (sigma-70 family)